MRKREFVVTPTAGIIVVVIAALSAVVGIVANFVSGQQSDVPAQTAQRIDDLRQAAPGAANDASAVDIPAFALATPTATPQAAPTVVDVVYVVITPTPASVQQVIYLIATPTRSLLINGSVSTPLGQMPCSEIYLEWGETDARAQNRDWLPWFAWFESISREERMHYWSMCSGG